MKPRQQVELMKQAHQMPGEWERLIRQLSEVLLRDSDELVSDGFGSGASDGQPRSVGDHSDPTARKATGVSKRDPFGETLRTIAHHVSEIRAQTGHLKGIIEGVLADSPKAEREPAVPNCLACGGLALPRPKSGYCGACYMAWRREGSTERADFERRRLAAVTTKD